MHLVESSPTMGKSYYYPILQVRKLNLRQIKKLSEATQLGNGGVLTLDIGIFEEFLKTATH